MKNGKRHIIQSYAYPILSILMLLQCVVAETDKDALPKVEKGFEINFFVKEPHIINPSALCFDKLGRLYVGAGPQYRGPKPDSPTDYIKILIDDDRDGIAEKVKTFAEGFNSVQGLAWKGDELWVANAPELTVLRDTDGDDVADEYQVIYTGLNNLRHSLHGLNWGPDGWLYMSMGNTWVKKNAPTPFRELQGLSSDDKTRYPLTKVYTRETYKKTYHELNKDEKEGGIFRCRPGGYDLELYARGMRNPWDICMDSGFNWLGTDNDPGRPAERIFMPVRWGHYSMRHPWMFDWMGKHPAVAPSSDLFPSVSGSGTGVVYYASTHFPEQYRNRYLIADWTNNCIFLYNPKWDGALQVPAEKKRKIADGGVTEGSDLGYVGRKGRSLFRPTDIEVGPDGALYMAGWGSVYGTEYVPKDKWTPEENAKYQGRVFRLRHKDPLISRSEWFPAKRNNNIKTWSFKELIDDIGHQVQVWRVHAQDEIIRRGSRIRDSLLEILDSGKLTESQTTWTSWALGRIDGPEGDHKEMIQFALGQRTDNLNLRIQATRIFGENKLEKTIPVLIKLLSDPEPRLRLAAIQSLGNIGWGKNTDSILAALAEEKDRLTLYTAWQVMRRQIPVEARKSLLTDPRGGIRLMAALGLMEEGQAETATVFKLLDTSDQRIQRISGDWLQKTNAFAAEISISISERNFRHQSMVTMKVNGDFDIRYTLDGSTPKNKSLKYAGQLVLKDDAIIKAAAFSAQKNTQVSKFDMISAHKITDSEWADRLFVRNIKAKGSRDQYRVIDDGLQRGVLAYSGSSRSTITSVPDSIAGATMIRTTAQDSDNLENELISFDLNLPATVYVAYDSRYDPPNWLKNEYDKTSLKVITSQSGEFVIHKKNVKAGKVTLGSNKTRGGGTPEMYQVFLTKSGTVKTTFEETRSVIKKANTKHGEEIFFGRGTCFACHQVKGKGIAIGPDLNAINKRHDTDYVIRSILVPDEYIVEGFQQTGLEMKDGRKLFGMIQEETAQTVKIYLLTGEQISVSTKNISKRNDAKHSSMPSSFAYTLTSQDVADVTDWIMKLE